MGVKTRNAGISLTRMCPTDVNCPWETMSIANNSFILEKKQFYEYIFHEHNEYREKHGVDDLKFDGLVSNNTYFYILLIVNLKIIIICR